MSIREAAIAISKSLICLNASNKKLTHCWNGRPTYLNDKKLFYKLQSGFRTNFSTDSCLIYLSDYIRFQMDKGNLVGMVLLDLQKAFDTVDHDVLKMKLESLGLSSNAIRWFRLYVSGRQQLVDVSGTFSSQTNITCGVPQGSVLGPLCS